MCNVSQCTFGKWVIVQFAISKKIDTFLSDFLLVMPPLAGHKEYCVAILTSFHTKLMVVPRERIAFHDTMPV